MTTKQSIIKVLLQILVLVLLVGPATAEASVFSYDPHAWNGPSHWGSLDLGDDTVNACNGTKQSPFGWTVTPTPSCDLYGNLRLTDTSDTSACSDARAQFRVTDHNLQATWPDDNDNENDNDNNDACVVQIPGTPSVIPGWQLMQFHLHTTPEHILYGPPPASAELHMVHTGINTKGGMLAVIAVRLRATSNSDDHPILESWISHWQQQQQQTLASSGCQESSSSASSGSNSNTNINNYNNLYDIIPNNTAYYQYYGSLTTPPCSEIVHWSVAEDMVAISHTQWQRLQSLLVNYHDTTTCQLATVTNIATENNDNDSTTSSSTNNRPLQDRKGRAFFKLCPTDMVPMTNQQSTLAWIFKGASRGLFILLCLGAILAAMLSYHQKHSLLRLRPAPNRQGEKKHPDPSDSESARCHRTELLILDGESERTELFNRSKQQPQQPNYT